MRNVFFLAFCIFSILSRLNAVTGKNTDSLIQLLNSAKIDTLKMRLLTDIGSLVEDNFPDSAARYFQQTIEIANIKPDDIYYAYFKALALQCLGVAQVDLGNFKDALENYNRAIESFKSLASKKNKKLGVKIQKGLSKSYGNKGVLMLYHSQYDTAVCYIKQAYYIDSVIGDSNAMYLKTANLGLVFMHKNDYDNSLLYYLKARQYFQRNNMMGRVATMNNNIGVIYLRKSNLLNAFQYFQAALRIHEENNNLPSMASSLNNLGTVHKQMGNLEQAIFYFKRANQMFQQLNNLQKSATTLVNIGICYNERRLYDSALTAFHSAKDIYISLNSPADIIDCMTNISNVYVSQSKYDLAEKMLVETLSFNEITIDDKGLVFNNLSYIYHKQSKLEKDEKVRIELLKKALKYALQGYEIADTIGLLERKLDVSMNLKDICYDLGNYKDALKYAQTVIELKDSIFSQEKTKALTEMETKYQTEKKQQEIEKQKLTIDKQQADISRKQAQRNLFIIGSALLLLLVLVVYRSFLQKKKANQIITEKNVLLSEANEEIRAQRDEIEAQRDEIERQRDMVMEQKKQIEEIHGELTSSIRYASRIQGVMLPSPDEMFQILGEHFILFLPRDVVSGDFYWAARVGQMQVFCVADCTGHGVPGAFMSMLGISLLNEAVHNQSITQASHVLEWMRENIIHSLKQKGLEGEQKDGMDISLCAVDTVTLEMQFAGANNPCWIVRSNGEGSSITELKPDRMPLAIHRRMEPFTNQVFRLEKGDRIYLLSDGFEDQFGGPEGKKYMVKRLREFVVAHSALAMEEQKALLQNELLQWRGTNEQVDDVTILGVKI